MLGKLYGDVAIAALLDDRAMLGAMLRVEAALARVQGRMGLIPAAAAEAIAQAAAALQPDPAALADDVARAGIAAQPLIAALRQAAGPHGQHAHFGATSQDITDTALALQLKAILPVLRDRIRDLRDVLQDQATHHADLPVPARTRFQIAAPTTLGARLAIWAAPLSRHLDRLDDLTPRLLTVSLHGAAGTGAALGYRMAETRQALAAELGLSAPDLPWHACRDGIAELGGWLSLVTGSLGKMGLDLILLGQSGIGEVRAGTGGGSSTMPQKSNPVAAEALVSLARLNAGAVGTLHQALIHALERDGSALGIEWLTLPDMLDRTGAALRLARDLAATLVPKPDRIAASFAQDRGAMMAEAAGFALSRSMPRAAALDIVGQALREMDGDRAMTLAGALSRLVPQTDWAETLRPQAYLGEAPRHARQSGSTEEIP